MNYENATILHNTDTNTDQINKKKNRPLLHQNLLISNINKFIRNL